MLTVPLAGSAKLYQTEARPWAKVVLRAKIKAE
jgi:hypothetical protein